nr:uncharacterized protein LOC117278019 [Nicotiana tomentosiformis]
MANKKHAKTHIQWRLHSGNSSFWWDNWLGTGNLASYRPQGSRPGNIKVFHFWSSGTWDLQKLNASTPAHMIQFISQVPIHHNPLMPDKLIWKETPSDVSVALNPKLNLLITSSVGVTLLRLFGKSSEDPLDFLSLCNAKYGSKSSSMTRVLFSISSDTNQLLKVYYPDIPWPLGWYDLLSMVENLQYHTSITSVAWLKPKAGFVKVNSDGSALNNPGKIGVGVIIRGRPLHTCYSSPLGEGSNNLAKTQAVVLGMQWCLVNGITKIHLEADSALLIHWLNHTSAPPWNLDTGLQNLKELQVV